MIRYAILSDKVSDIFNDIGIYNIASTDISYIDISDDYNYITYLPISRLGYVESNGFNPWKYGRNKIKIGRFIKNILPLDDSHIENIVNQYKSGYKIKNDPDSLFNIVSGNKIYDCYQTRNYKTVNGILGKSCMNNARPSKLSLYTRNKHKCKLLIREENGKIVSRALLWHTNIGYYIDRPYSIYDSDIQLYIKYAEIKGYKHFYDRDKLRMTVSMLRIPREIPYLDTFKNIGRTSIKNY